MKPLLAWFEQLRKKYFLVSFLSDMAEVYLDRRVTRSAAEFSYYLMLTLFPTIIMLIGIVGLLPITIEQILDMVSGILPESSVQILADYVAYVQAQQSMALLTGGLLTTVTAASAAFRGLLSISGEIYGRKAFHGIWSILISFLFSLVMLVMIYASIVVVLTGSWFVRTLQGFFDFLQLPFTIPRYWIGARLVLLFALAMVFLLLVYWITAPKGKYRPPAVLGAALASLALTGASVLFSNLISYSSRYSLVYGSLASSIILMVWLYMCGNIVILGNVFNYVLWQYQRGLPVAFILEKRI